MSKISLAQAKERAEKACVRVDGRRGMGVLVPGGFVLTAASCINLSEEGVGNILLNNHAHHWGLAADGTPLVLTVYAVELACNIGVLGSMDDQEMPHWTDDFERWRAATTAVPVSSRRRKVGTPFNVHALTSAGSWVAGQATVFGFEASGSFAVKLSSPLPAGSDGGPIIDDDGDLVSLCPVSISAEELDEFGFEDQTSDGPCPHIYLALPRWIWERIEAAPFQPDERDATACVAWLRSPTGALAELLATYPEVAVSLRGALIHLVETGDEASLAVTRDIILNGDIVQIPEHLQDAVRVQLEHLRLWPIESPKMASSA